MLSGMTNFEFIANGGAFRLINTQAAFPPFGRLFHDWNFFPIFHKFDWTPVHFDQVFGKKTTLQPTGFLMHVLPAKPIDQF
jgi:hypothetical protein